MRHPGLTAPPPGLILIHPVGSKLFVPPSGVTRRENHASRDKDETEWPWWPR